MRIFSVIIIVSVLSVLSVSCAATHESGGGEKNLSVTSDWKDWRQPPPWSRR